MPDVGSVVTKKIGPLPGWGWLLIVVGGAWGYKLYRGRSGIGASAPSPASLSTDPSATPNFAPGTGNAGGGAGFFGGSVTQTPYGSPAARTNAQWVLSTTDQMVAGGANPSAVTNALNKYVTGAKLTDTEQSLVNQALTHYGSPPEGTLPVKTDATAVLSKKYVSFIDHAGDSTLYGVTPEGQEIPVTYAEWAALGFPKPVQGPARIREGNPENVHMYVVKSGDTLSGISQRVYGTADTARIRAANPGVAERPLIGATIYTP
jgi:nucleoid-associated protein YgaU